MITTLSPAQAEWLVTFMRNVPGSAQAAQAAQEAETQAYAPSHQQTHVGHEPSFDYDCYPVTRY